MSKKIKAENKHLNQNLRGEVRSKAKYIGWKRPLLIRGVEGYRRRDSGDFNKTTPNAYQMRKLTRSQKGKSKWLGRLFG